jgi:hypothetical protein
VTELQIEISRYEKILDRMIELDVQTVGELPDDALEEDEATV